MCLISTVNGAISLECFDNTAISFIIFFPTETLRKYTFGKAIKRLCCKDYKTEEGHIIKSGTLVIIPTEAIHSDPDIYSNPQEFNPERFTCGQFKYKMSFLPFGAGPRGCIGAKFGDLQVKFLIICLLRNYRLSMSSRSENPIQIDHNAKLMKPKNGVILNVERI